MLISSGLVTGHTEKNFEKEGSVTVENVESSQYELITYEGKTLFTSSVMNSYLANPNFPLIPKITKTYSYPQGSHITSVQCNPTTTQHQSINQKMYITPEPQILNKQKDINTDHSKDYQSNELYPSSWYTYRIGSGLIGDEIRTILTVEMYPIRYIESTQEIIVTDSFDVSIKYENSEENRMIATADDETYDFLILGPYEFKEEIELLVDHKIQRNLSTIYVPLNFVYNGMYFSPQGRDDSEKIKYFIKQAIEEWNVKNVMLVGGSDDFPTRTTHIFIANNAHEPELFVSDLYYADIYNKTGGFCSWDTNNNDKFGEFNWEGETDDVDLYPDVHLGRLAVTSEEELTNVVNKIISYENQESHKKDWFSNLILVGGDTFPGDSGAVSEGEYANDKIADIMNGFNPIKLYASNGKVSVNGYITNEVEGGAGFVSFAGHGNPTSWSTHPSESENIWIPAGGFKSGTALNLENNDRYPIVMISACSVGKFNVNDETLTWAFVSNPNGGGIAAFGTTALGYGNYGTATTQSATGKMLLDTFRAYKDDGAITFGEIWTRALNRYISPRLSKYDYKTIEEWQPFGDPTLSISEDSKEPLKPDISGPSSGKPDEEHLFEAATTDPDGDDIYYMFDWGDGTYSHWLGPYYSGGEVSARHTWSERGDYEVRVKAKDDHGVIGDWSDPLPITMPKSFPFFGRLSQLFDWLSSFSFN
ncbi:MAG TPA: C25 family cysteine peptidase [Candidatus Thermoplasmatota archaeon]|nr:C25 family cysteine peptidase [Candidatus Thermoplasmatota archaeon]